jgi:Ca2+-binding RTX toxin-like protein
MAAPATTVLQGGAGTDVLVGGAQHDILFGNDLFSELEDSAVDYLYGDFGTNLNEPAPGAIGYSARAATTSSSARAMTTPSPTPRAPAT